MSRHREQDFRIQECGTQYNRFAGPDPLLICMTHGLWRTCDDVIGNFDVVNPLQIDESFTHFPVLNGSSYSGSGVLNFQFVDCPITYRPNPPDPRNHWGLISIADQVALAWRILAETNPSTPHVSVPTSLGELKDLPSLVRSWGTSLLQKAASGYLSWRWCIRPMIGDIIKLWKFTRAVDERIVNLYRLRDNRTLRRRCSLGTQVYAAPAVNNFLFQSSLATIRGFRQETYTSKMWGTCQYAIDTDSELPTMGFNELENFARRLTYGFTTHEALATAWELTPWSWLVDWFSNVGTIIAATNNSIGCTWSKIALMRTITSVIDAKPDPAQTPSWVTVSGDYKIGRVRKERYSVVPAIPVPLPYLPVLDIGKLSILASLAALRR